MKPETKALLAARGIICGAITTEIVAPREETLAMSHSQLAAPTPAPLPADLNVAWKTIVKALGLPPDAASTTVHDVFEGVRAAVEGATSPDAQEATARTRLSVSELRVVDSTPGATALRFLSAKKAFPGLLKGTR